MANIASTVFGLFIGSARSLFICFLIIACVSTIARAQNTSSTDGSTPLAISPGAPAGSYSLSGFDNINLYNGNLNFSLPLVNVAGRGGARYSMVLPIEQHWTVRHFENDYQEADYPQYNVWYTTKPGYGPGVMAGRQVNGGDCNIHTRVFSTTALTRLTFIAPDGTEYELRDQQSGGQPKISTCSNYYLNGDTRGYNRGRNFVTADGTATTFVSDTDIYDYISLGTTSTVRW
ncbi:MAG TPA: hypothetical protein VKB86_07930, partial [Pyrinomonadaceae bacterium]|nr:hypothetical protein [Pyrinomonadaceae bacterium]